MQSLPRAANSEAVALVHVVYFGRARAVNGWFRVGAVHLQGLRLSRELRAQSVAALRAV